LRQGAEIAAKCHSNAEQPLKRWVAVLSARWEEASQSVQQREERIKAQIQTLKDQEALLDELLKWLSDKEDHLNFVEEDPIPEDIKGVERLLEEHQEFMGSLRERQPEFDEFSKVRRRQETELGTSKEPTKKKQKKAICSPKIIQVTDRWNTLWLAAGKRQQKLQERLDYLKEKEKMKNFNFDEWRQRYMGWMNHNKARVMDFFRRQDKDNDGKVTREEFIEGILKSGFKTTRMELEAVADLFDKSGDGLIDYKEFIAALKAGGLPKPQSEAEKIKNEVHRQVELCTCAHRYKVKEVGEGRYKFGDSQKLRLVRILRSTVMVRVGGGWEALDEFLVKHDPCRAKGRTNVELRERFILPEGASQVMHGFTPRRGGVSHGQSLSGDVSLATSSGSGSTSGASPRFSTPQGPVTKIRQKTERSLPMTRTKVQNPQLPSPADNEVLNILDNSTGANGNDSRKSSGLLSPAESPFDRRPSSRRSLRGGITNIPAPFGSRPPSRADSEASDLSIGSRDSLSFSGPTRIPSLRGKKMRKFT